MLAEGPDLIAILPQKPPMVMVHRLLAAGAEATVTRFRVEEDCVLVEDGRLSEAGLVENIAQTAAAGVGYSYREKSEQPPIGFIASIRELSILGLPAVGEEITTKVRLVNQIMEFSIVQGKVTSGNKVLAECEMRIFLKPSDL
jgi:predicted hotdog family 3-hydroxylacyl-ACP dehydratase